MAKHLRPSSVAMTMQWIPAFGGMTWRCVGSWEKFSASEFAEGLVPGLPVLNTNGIFSTEA